VAGFHNLLNFAGEVFSDPRQLRQILACGNHVRYTSRQVFDCLGCCAVGANAKWVRRFNLQKMGETRENLRYVCIVDYHTTMTPR
jgi:hypothetical protein